MSGYGARRWLGALALVAAGCVTGPAGQPGELADHGCATAAPAPRYAVTRPADLPDAVTVALEKRQGMLFVSARVDGCEAGDFIVDTGAAVTVLAPDVADRLRVPIAADLTVGGLHGLADATFRKVSSLTVGDVALDARSIVAVSLADFAPALGGGVAGIIGFGTLGPAPFSIDFAAGRLTIHNPARFAPPASAPGQLLRLNGGLPFVEATLADGVTVWLMLDSGSKMPFVLWRDVVEAHPGAIKVPHKRWGTMMGIGGGTQVMLSEVEILRTLGRELDGVGVAIQDRPPNVWQHPQAAGVVGLPVLADLRVTIDPDRRRVWAEIAR